MVLITIEYYKFSGLYRLGYRGTDAEMGAERFRQSEPSVDLAIPRIVMCGHPREDDQRGA